MKNKNTKKEKGIWSEFAEEELLNNMPDDEEDTHDNSNENSK